MCLSDLRQHLLRGAGQHPAPGRGARRESACVCVCGPPRIPPAHLPPLTPSPPPPCPHDTTPGGGAHDRGGAAQGQHRPDRGPAHLRRRRQVPAHRTAHRVLCSLASPSISRPCPCAPPRSLCPSVGVAARCAAGTSASRSCAPTWATSWRPSRRATCSCTSSSRRRHCHCHRRRRSSRTSRGARVVFNCVVLCCVVLCCRCLAK